MTREAAVGSRDASGGEATVVIDGIATGGSGVGRLPSGKAVFVQRTAPGDRVRIRVDEEKRRWARGSLQKVLHPGAGRRRPPCPHYDRCGGCTLEHLDYDRQLEAKAGVVEDALRRIGGMDELAPEVEPSPREFRYRSRASFTLLRTRNGRVLAGFHELNRPGRIVDLGGECLLLEEELARAWDGLRNAWGPGARRLPSGARLRLTLQATGNGAVLTVSPHTARPGRKDWGKSGAEANGDPHALLADVPELKAVWWKAPDQEALRLAGQEVRETRAGQTFAVRGGSFLQVNRGGAEMLHQHVLRQVGRPRGLSAVDAYCGVGGYGHALARHGARVTGIEVDPAAARSAREEAPPSLEVLEGPVEERLTEVLPTDLALLNPPRQGLASKVAELLAERGPARIVYVSCDPPTLARDLGRLEGTYDVEGLRCFDLFPQTAHVETVATLRRRGTVAAAGPIFPQESEPSAE